jgi:hypothetical protein
MLRLERETLTNLRCYEGASNTKPLAVRHEFGFCFIFAILCVRIREHRGEDSNDEHADPSQKIEGERDGRMHLVLLLVEQDQVADEHDE